MLRLASAFFDIALHRRGPDQLPASHFLLGLVAAVYLVCLVVAVQVSDDTRPFRLPAYITEAGLGVLFVWSLLRAFGLERRLIQTLTALFGIDALMTALSLPFVTARSLEQSAGSPGAPDFVLLGLLLWNIDVWGFVVGRAIGRPYFLGLAFVIGWVLLMESLRAAMFPPVIP